MGDAWRPNALEIGKAPGRDSDGFLQRGGMIAWVSQHPFRPVFRAASGFLLHTGKVLPVDSTKWYFSMMVQWVKPYSRTLVDLLIVGGYSVKRERTAKK